mmetsp:Transcript_856/g.1357  ORF Transcript_856/g.1357 Transcript_856/m.1357 type:complete len:453 (+) Transcript_856:16-1374(+)
MNIMSAQLNFLEKGELHGKHHGIEIVGKRADRYTNTVKQKKYEFRCKDDQEGNLKGSENEALKNGGKERQNWEDMFDRLLQYKAMHGDCLVPKRYKKDPKLRAWVSLQRRTKGLMCGTHRERLEAIGFCWEGLRPDWDTMFRRLVEYKLEHGDCLVSQKDTTEQKLGTWVDNQRRKKGKMSEECKKKLDSIGFAWAVRDPRESWDSMFQRLVRYKLRHGNCIVPAKCCEDEKLGHWVTHQRRTKHKLSIDHFKRLDELDFVWGELKQDFNIMFNRLEQYKEKHGHLFVPRQYDLDPLFGRWVCEQRQNQDEISEERRKRLDSIGFIWNPSITMKQPQNPIYERLTSEYCRKRGIDRLGGQIRTAACDAKRFATNNRCEPAAFVDSPMWSRANYYSSESQGADDLPPISSFGEAIKNSPQLKASYQVRTYQDLKYTPNGWLLPLEEEADKADR